MYGIQHIPMFFRKASMLSDPLWKAPKEGKGAFATIRFLILYSISQKQLQRLEAAVHAKRQPREIVQDFAVQLCELE